MIQPDALDAIRRGLPGVHIVTHGQPLEALAVNGDGTIRTRYFCDDAGPDVPAAETHALERTYPRDDSLLP